VSLDLSGVNWVAVLLAAIANLVIGMIWYMRPVLGARWAELAGVDLNNRPSPTVYLVAIGAAVIAATILALLAKGLGAHDAINGAFVGLLGWLAFQATNSAVGGAFEGRPSSLWLINTANAAVTFGVMGAIIGATE
jgi:hypothetical protein